MILGAGLITAFVPLRSEQQAEPSARLQEVMALERPIVIAHRGYSMAAPENTLPAFRLALLAESDLVELDYFHSSDGVPIVLHDRTLDRTTNVRLR
jgi:glycerophosphoryl diester phosphodiesterase